MFWLGRECRRDNGFWTLFIIYLFCVSNILLACWTCCWWMIVVVKCILLFIFYYQITTKYVLRALWSIEWEIWWRIISIVNVLIDSNRLFNNQPSCSTTLFCPFTKYIIHKSYFVMMKKVSSSVFAFFFSNEQSTL